MKLLCELCKDSAQGQLPHWTFGYSEYYITGKHADYHLFETDRRTMGAAVNDFAHHLTSTYHRPVSGWSVLRRISSADRIGAAQATLQDLPREGGAE